MTQAPPPPAPPAPPAPTAGVDPAQHTPWPAVNQFVAAVRHGRFTDAEAAYAACASWSQRDQAMFIATDGNDHPGIAEWAQGGHPAALVTHGRQLIDLAWEARGSGTSDTVTADGAQRFLTHLNEADDQLHRAMRADPQSPLPWGHLLTTSKGLGIPIAERKLRFAQLERRAPNTLMGRLEYADAVAGKWGGDDVPLWEWALQIHAEAPLGSPLRAVGAKVFANRHMFTDRKDRDPRWLELLGEMAAASILTPEFRSAEDLEQLEALAEFAAAFDLAGDRANIEATVAVYDEVPGWWEMWTRPDAPDHGWAPLRRKASGGRIFGRRGRKR